MRNFLERALDKVIEQDNKKCEVCHSRRVDRHNETVRDKKSKIAKIISICNPCFRKITGAK